MSANNGRAKGCFWIVGFCSFISLMCNGIVWILNKCSITGGILSTISNIALIVLYIAALFAGWIWISGTSIKKSIKLVLEVIFLVFAVLCILGVVSL